ncbi:hypothetical protein AZL_011890 [Azospirillum sp. B510]|uniref:hypothetical protein n=1 Tax=Azospirillum sp. (strain B510) TaxID=137722 RepID=UPI0001C4C058|nr:hypothetical protein [Azospirillum sp. B510]BAI71827.1 hypothetical protein AZL_011890 [Azospirillum sp. B510]
MDQKNTEDAAEDAPGGLYGVRPAGREGWFLRDHRGDRAALTAALFAEGIAAEVVEIAPFLRRGPMSLPDFILDEMAMHLGWSFDPAIDGWRAPGEAVASFPGTPLPVDCIDVRYEVPAAFWMPITIAAGGQSVIFEVSNTWDPIPDITPWLERVLDGGYPRLTIDREGDYTELHVLPAAEGVRFVVALLDEEWRTPIDVSLPRLALIAGFYCPLVAMWESDAMVNEGWRRWHFDLAVGASGLTAADHHPYPVRSARIDVALADLPGSLGGAS